MNRKKNGHVFNYFYVLEESEVVALEEFYEKGVLKYSTKCIGKHLRWSLFYNKAAGRRPLTSINTETAADVFL